MEIQLLSGTATQEFYRDYRTYENAGLDDKTLKRVGVLLGMKIDFKDSASKLRYGYLPKSDLMRQGYSESQINHLKARLREAEVLYTNLGGSKVQFARAILEGRGNADGKVKIAYETLQGTHTTEEEKVLNASVLQIIKALNANTTLGNIETTSTNSTTAFTKASDTLFRIGQISNSITNITQKLATTLKSDDTTPVITPAAEEGSWLERHKSKVVTGSLLAGAALLVTNMKLSPADKKKLGLAGVKHKKRRTVSRRKKGTLKGLQILELQ